MIGRLTFNVKLPIMCHFHLFTADDIFKCVFLNENLWIPIDINISLMFVPKGPMNNIPSLVQIMFWR